MVKIFAKHGTDEKAVVVCPRDQVRNIQLALARKYGGNWLCVDKIQPNGEILKFNDGLKYLGFHGKDERYCKCIEVLLNTHENGNNANTVLVAGVFQVDINAKWECCKCGWIGTHSESADKTPVISDAWLLICPKCGNKDEFYACR